MAKIITWINNDIRRVDNNINFQVKPFDYQGKRITNLKIENGDESKWKDLAPVSGQPIWHGRVKLDSNKILQDGNTLVIDGDERETSAKKWEPDDFTFTFEPTRAEEWNQLGSPDKIDLTIREKKLVPEVDYSPTVSKITINYGLNGNYFNKFFKHNTQYQLKINLAQHHHATNGFKMTGGVGENILDLSNYPVKLTILEISKEGNTIPSASVEEKVRAAFRKATAAYNNRNQDLNSAIQALKELIKLGTKGSQEERNIYDRLNQEEYLGEYAVGFMIQQINFIEFERSLPTTDFYQVENSQTREEERKIEEKKIRAKIRQTINNVIITKNTSNNLEEIKNAITALESIKNNKGSEDWELSEFNNQNGETCLTELKAKQKSLENPTQKPNPGSNDNSNPNSPKPNPGAEDKNNFIKIETEARQKIKDQSEKVASELTRLLSEANDKNDYEELGAIIQKIDKYSGEEEYQINHKVEIQALKNRWGNLNKAKHKEKVAQKTKKTLESAGVKKGDLDSETQQLITQLENGEIIEVNDINQAEDKIIANVGKRKEETSLEKWLRKAKEISEKLKQKVVNDLKEIKKEAEEVVKNFTHFAASSNVFQQKAYLSKKSEVEKSLKELKALDFMERKEESEFSWKPILIVGGISVTIILVALSIKKICRKKIN